MERKDLHTVDLSTLNGGAVTDLFAEEWRRVMDNIQDINTKPDAVRKIIIEVKVKPDKSRHYASTEVSVSFKPVTTKPHEDSIYFGQEGERMVAYQENPRQGSLGLEPENVTPISKAQEG